jgi:hypothetical protein
MCHTKDVGLRDAFKKIQERIMLRKMEENIHK